MAEKAAARRVLLVLNAPQYGFFPANLQVFVADVPLPVAGGAVLCYAESELP